MYDLSKLWREKILRGKLADITDGNIYFFSAWAYNFETGIHYEYSRYFENHTKASLEEVIVFDLELGFGGVIVSLVEEFCSE